MRTKAAIIVILLLGGIFAAYWLFDNRTISSAQMETITVACPQCHGSVPSYGVALTVHNKHAAFNCSLCHSDVSGLKQADSIKIDLKWVGVGLISVVLLALITNLIIMNGKGKAN